MSTSPLTRGARPTSLPTSPFGVELPHATPFDAPAHRERLRQIREAQRATREAEHPWNRYERWRAERERQRALDANGGRG